MLIFLLACTPDKDTGTPTDSASDTCPTLALASASLTFDATRVGSASTATLLAANDCATGGALELDLSVDDAAFSVASPSLTVDAGAVGSIEITWTPADFAPASGTLALATNDPTQATVFVPLSGTPVPDADGDGVDEVDDCNDADATVHPGATEAWYDGVDQDCDGNDDDQDEDGFAVDSDCVDTDAGVHPDATEIWYDGTDQDCDGNDTDQDNDGFAVDSDCVDTDTAISPAATEIWYDGTDQDCDGNDTDQDHDGFAVDSDCVDTDAAVNPAATEVWYDGTDQDCDGNDADQDNDGFAVDSDCVDTDPTISPAATEAWYDGTDQDCDGNDDDQDSDGFAVDSDCVDTDAAISPAATEVWYDGTDQDCDGNDADQDADGFAVDSDCVDTDATISPAATEIWYDGTDQDCDGNDTDQDGDGYPQGADCADTDAAISPAATEIWYDGVDQDCAGGNDWDQDGDGAALYPTGADCNDTDASTTAGTAEIVDGIDNDCNGMVDDGFATAGDVLVTEIMANPSAVSDTLGEWFEVYNPSSVRVDLVGWTIYSDDGGSFTVATSVPIEPGEYAVLGVEDDPALNGGVDVDYVYARTSFSFADSADTLYLLAGTTTVFELSYDARWGVSPGASLSLDPSRLSAASAATSSNWCDATSDMTSGDAGTPGAENDLCSSIDHDGDRQTVASGDCDDADATVYYGARETTGDGIDQNCNVADEETPSLSSPYLSNSSGRNALASGTGDFTGDGTDDLVLTAYASDPDAWVVDGDDYLTWAGVVTSYDEAQVTNTGTIHYSRYIGADVTGDGLADLIGIGGNPSGATPAFAVWSSPVTGNLGQADIDENVVVTGNSFYTAAAAADFDGDGVDEVAFYAPGGSATSGSGTGATGIFELAALAGALDMTDATLVITGTGMYDGVVQAADANDDGHVDLLTGSYPLGLCFGDGLATTGAEAVTSCDVSIEWGTEVMLMDGDASGTVDLVAVSGGVYLFPDIGSTSGTVATADYTAAAIPTEGSLTLTLGSSPIDDDGDGFDEIPLHIFQYNGGAATYTHTLYSPLALAAGEMDASSFTGAWTTYWAGWDVAADFDGDGTDELTIGYYGSAGQNYVVRE